MITGKEADENLQSVWIFDIIKVQNRLDLVYCVF